MIKDINRFMTHIYPTPSTDSKKATKPWKKLAGIFTVCSVLVLSTGCGGSSTEETVTEETTETTTDTSTDTGTSTEFETDVELNPSDFPEYYGLSDDGSQLLRGKNTADDFYQMSTVENFYIYFDSDDWFDEVTTATDNDEYVSASIKYDDETLESVGIQFKGNTSYRNSDERKSFGIKLDYLIDGQDIDGYNTLNFNNAMDDASYMREVFYVNQSRQNMPAANGNFINVYVNDEFWGVYPNIQQLNKDHLKQWYLSDEGTNWRASSSASSSPGSFNDGTTALNYLGDEGSLYESAYELKSTSADSPYDYMAAATKALDGISEDNVAEVSKSFDIDGALWFIAHEIIFGDDDGYISKGAMDYYVHYDVATGKMLPVEYDGNSVMSSRNDYDVFYRIDDEMYPVANKLLNIPELRQRYLAHFRSILLQSFDPDVAEPILEQYQALIDDGVANDPHPHNGISYAGFDDAVDEVKNYIADRYALLTNDSEVSLQGPSISNVYQQIDGETVDSITSSQSPTITATVEHDDGIKTVYGYYGTGVVGTFTKVELFDDGAHDDGAANDNVYANSIPAQESGVYVRYYVEAIANDNAEDFGTVSYLPVGAEHDVFIYRVDLEVAAQSDLVINEFMASNSNTVADGSGEYDDWLELYNNSSEAIDLTGYYLSDDANNLTKWTFGSMSISGNGYLAIWLDEDEEQGDNHANFKLSASGEDIILSNAQGETIDLVTFTTQEEDVSYGRSPNGTGDFQSISASFEEENP